MTVTISKPGNFSMTQEDNQLTMKIIFLSSPIMFNTIVPVLYYSTSIVWFFGRSECDTES